MSDIRENFNNLAPSKYNIQRMAQSLVMSVILTFGLPAIAQDGDQAILQDSNSTISTIDTSFDTQSLMFDTISHRDDARDDQTEDCLRAGTCKD